MSGANSINIRTPIAAVNSSSRLRVYFGSVTGEILEAVYEGKWEGGHAIATGTKIYSPIAATSAGELNQIRVYYLDNNNRLRERAYDSGRGWYEGALNGHNFQVAPYSQIAAAFLPGTSSLRVYAQLENNTIQEFGWDGNGWSRQTNIGAALPGSSIAVTAFRTSQLSIRVYLQDTNLDIFERAFDSGRGWYNGALKFGSTIPRAALAVTSFNASSSGVSLRVYYSASNDRLLEKGWDGSGPWYDGGFSVNSIPASYVASISWDSVQIRVYYQKEVDVTAVSEEAWVGRWTPGQSALPPA